ncbi:MAG: hypothetical protein RIS76_1312 [Verrucomicrobiota bacterium]|jgi:subfamily B ATP-binding cassette protein MsbA
MKEFLIRLSRILWPQRVRLMLGILCGVVYALSNSLLMLVVKIACDLLFPTVDAPAVPAIPATVVKHFPDLAMMLEGWLSWAGGLPQWVWVAAIPVVMGLRGGSAFGNFYFLARAGNQAIHELRIAVFNHLLRLPVGYFSAARTGDLISRLINDTMSLRTVVESSLGIIVKEPLSILFLVVALATTQPRLTSISLLVFPLCVLPIVFFGRKVRKAARAASLGYAQLSDTMQEAFTGQRVVKAYNLEPEFGRRFAQSSAHIVGQTMRTVRGSEIPSLLVEFSASVGVALVFVFVLRQPKGPGAMSAGDFFGFLTGVFLLYQPVKNLSRFYGQLQQARAAGDRIQEVLETAVDIPDPVAPVPVRAAGSAIRFDGITFGYGDKVAVRDIDLTIAPGQMVALVGASGSGKTTLTNLLLRFYDPQAGAVRIGDVDLRAVSTRELRDQIAVVTQETILFNDTIRANIRLGRPLASDAEVESAARAAQAHEFIVTKPGGYEFVIGERGGNLSGGQRQRLAIARALLKDAPILVLDEATSALDSESERAVQTALEVLMRGRTTLCIAHRLSTIQHADVILVMDQGRIVERGRHEELLARGSFYSRLHAFQFGAGASAAS